MVLFGLLLPMLLAFLAMGVDLGQGYLQRRDNQNGADAASVAGELAITHGGTDSAVQNTIKHVLTAGGYNAGAIVFATPTTPAAGSSSYIAYVDAEHGNYPAGTDTCTPLTTNQYVGSVGGSPPSAATCVHVKITTRANTLFSRLPILGFAQVSAAATSSAGQISPTQGAGSVVNASPTPTPAPWDTGTGEGFAIWGGNRADSTMLSVGSSVLFFADSGWDSGNDVLEKNCGSNCEYNATQNFKGLADSQCFNYPPLASTCTGPNGAHGNEAKYLDPGTKIQVVVVSSVTHSGNANYFTVIGLATINVLSSCPSSPAYLQTGTNGYCGVIQNIDAGSLNSLNGNPLTVATPTPTPIIGNSN